MDICRIPSDSEIINAIALTDEAAEILAQCDIRLDYEANELWIGFTADRWPLLDSVIFNLDPTPLEVSKVWFTGRGTRVFFRSPSDIWRLRADETPAE